MSSRSGDPRRRAAAAELARAADPVERAAARVVGLVESGKASDPLLVVAVPPLLLDLIATEYGLEPQRCIDDCLSLVYAYALLGILAEVRGAELAATDTVTGASATYGSLEPRWEDGMVHGHSVVRLPEYQALIDTSAEQFAMIAEVDGGPVITTEHQQPDVQPQQVRIRRGKLRLSYTLAPASQTAILLDHPVVRDTHAEHRRHGLNLASAAVIMLAERLSADRIRAIPHRRTVALIDAARVAEHHQTAAGDWRFCPPGLHGEPVTMRLDELPLPADTPPAIRPEL